MSVRSGGRAVERRTVNQGDGGSIIEERSIEAALELFCVISVSARHLAASK